MDWILIVGVIVAVLVGLMVLGFIFEDEGSRTKRKAKIAKRKAKIAKRKALRENKKRDEKLTPIRFEEAYKKHLKKKPKKDDGDWLNKIWKEEDILWRSLHSHLRLITHHQMKKTLMLAAIKGNISFAESQAAIFSRRYKASVKDIKTKTKPLIDVKEYWNKYK